MLAKLASAAKTIGGALIGGAGGPTTALSAAAGIVDDLYTSEEERLTRAEALAKVTQNSDAAQARINEVEAQHRTIFVAGWRPFLGWTLGVGVADALFINRWATLIGLEYAPIDQNLLLPLVYAILGMATARTIEKLTGRAR